MKKLILSLLILATCLVSCGPSDAEKEASLMEAQKEGTLVIGSNGKDYKIIKIGDCEYISGWSGSYRGGPILTHKGDCKNPIHNSK